MEIQESILKEAARNLDISPSDFRRAQERFNAVKSWLENGNYISGQEPEIYLQGSFRLGTVVRPYRGDKDGDFDIDQVCEIHNPSDPKNPAILKHDVGDRLKENADYLRMLDDEGKRCWTIEYASEENRPGFHLDVLPALSSASYQEHQIDITEKNDEMYSWSTSNPKGYYYWFKSKNPISQEQQESARKAIYQANEKLYQQIDEVPKRLVRTNLQRSLQLMKRHRDVHFLGKDHKPISIIMTTITAHVYTGQDIVTTITNFISYTLARYESFVRDGYLENDGILYHDGSEWVIPNPVDHLSPSEEQENFADKWNTDRMLPMAFFSWTDQLRRDLSAFVSSNQVDDLNLKTIPIGTAKSYSTSLPDRVADETKRKYLNTPNFLNLIHLGIDGKVAWEPIAKLALSNFRNAEDKDSVDIAKINFYQVAIHRGKGLSHDAIEDVRQLLTKRSDSAAFVLCCNLLMGSVTNRMIRDGLNESGYSNVLQWPILRLAKPERLFP